MSIGLLITVFVRLKTLPCIELHKWITVALHSFRISRGKYEKSDGKSIHTLKPTQSRTNGRCKRTKIINGCRTQITLAAFSLRFPCDSVSRTHSHSHAICVYGIWMQRRQRLAISCIIWNARLDTFVNALRPRWNNFFFQSIRRYSELDISGRKENDDKYRFELHYSHTRFSLNPPASLWQRLT